MTTTVEHITRMIGGKEYQLRISGKEASKRWF